MKTFLLIIVFLGIIAGGIAGIPPLLNKWLGVEQPLMTVISGSMWPALSRGDVVVINKVKPEDIKVGTVIVFKHENGYAVHRVISLDGWNIMTKGDANPVADTPILYNQVVGYVPALGSKLLKIPWLGNISLLTNPNAGAGDVTQSESLGFWDQLIKLLISPLGIIVVLGFLAVLFGEDMIKNLYYTLMPVSVRQKRSWQRQKQLKRRYGEDRAKKVLRLN